MKDGIIKGQGNSRYLKSVANFITLYPTYEAFAEALMTGTLPIDLNGINADGWTQVGTPLNTANLLTDTTAANIGVSANATPNASFDKLNTNVNSATTKANTAQTTASAALPKSGGAMTGVISSGLVAPDVNDDGSRADGAQVRNITASTTDLTAGTSSLTTGQVYLVYE